MADRKAGPDSQPRSAELDEKFRRIERFLDQNKANAILLSRHGNIAWITGGQVEARVALGVETAVCSLLLMRDGRRYYLAPNNEAARLADEEFGGLGYESVLYPWYEGPAARLRGLIGKAPSLADSPMAGAELVNLVDIRTPLLEAEIDRYRALAQDTASATVEVLTGLTAGVTEQEMAARTSAALLSRGIAPTVLLMGTDERIFRYKHAVPRAGVIDRYAMVNLCARRRGLVVSITRFVHFGKPSAELVMAFDGAARVNAALLHATRDGAVSSDIFAAAKKAYAAAGAAEEIERHHQGGACGYSERDWVVTPEGKERVVAPQAFAYNPSLRGAKAEDTVVLSDDRIEVLTGTPDLPFIDIEIEGVNYRSAGLLVR